jgi:hypothetical protein
VAPGPSWWGVLSDEARLQCTGDWCIKLDADEFIPEWEFDRLRRLVAGTSENLFPLKFKNFYANYKVLHAKPERMRWPLMKFAIHRNLPNVRAVGDGSSVRVGSEPWKEPPVDSIELHHFGAVRHPARLRQKWRNDGGMKAARPHFDRIPGFVYDLLPHDWHDEDLVDDLVPYEGPYIRAVLDEPNEFIRDDMKLYRWMKSRRSELPAGAAAKTLR